MSDILRHSQTPPNHFLLTIWFFLPCFSDDLTNLPLLPLHQLFYCCVWSNRVWHGTFWLYGRLHGRGNTFDCIATKLTLCGHRSSLDPHNSWQWGICLPSFCLIFST
jgi:hypothetical protein